MLALTAPESPDTGVLLFVLISKLLLYFVEGGGRKEEGRRKREETWWLPLVCEAQPQPSEAQPLCSAL